MTQRQLESPISVHRVISVKAITQQMSTRALPPRVALPPEFWPRSGAYRGHPFSRPAKCGRSCGKQPDVQREVGISGLDTASSMPKLQSLVSEARWRASESHADTRQGL